MKINVERCELAPGFSISRVLTGLWQIADMERDGAALDRSATAATMTPYVDAGLTTFDMADHYGSAEEITGEYRKRLKNPDDVQLLTKWVPEPGKTTKEIVRMGVQRALDRMQATSIDLLQFHAWNYADPNWLDSLFWLQELKQEGLIKHLGLTNFDAAHLRIAVHSGIEIASNQVCFSVVDQRPQQRLTELCETHNIKLLAFGTVAGGFLTDRWLGKPEPKMADLATWSQMKYKRFIDAAGGWAPFQEVLQTLNNIAKRFNVSLTNIACRYILEQQAVGGIIVGARLGRSEHIDETLRIFDFKLDDAALTDIRDTLSNLQQIPGNSGDEYRKPPFLTASGDLSHHLETIPPPYHAEPAANGGSRVLSGTPWEKIAGFSRAIGIGDRILVSGTTATHGDLAIGGNDPAAQCHFVIDKIEGAIQSLGGRLEDVVRTRIYIQRMNDWEPISRVHGERFQHIQPANTLIQANLIGDEYLVEMEAEAIISNQA